MYSILTESHDQGLLNKPSYRFLSSLVLEIFPEHSKSSKHLTGFLRHCITCAADYYKAPFYGPIPATRNVRLRNIASATTFDSGNTPLFSRFHHIEVECPKHEKCKEVISLSYCLTTNGFRELIGKPGSPLPQLEIFLRRITMTPIPSRTLRNTTKESLGDNEQTY